VREWTLLVIAVAMLTAGLVGCVRASSSETLIEYRRSGGIAGLDDHLVIRKSGEAVLTRGSERYEFAVGDDTMDHLQTLFSEAEFSQLQKEYLPSRQGADQISYVVTYDGHTVKTMDGAVPSSLQPILEALNQIVEDQSTS
jgi:hypothetical protein